MSIDCTSLGTMSASMMEAIGTDFGDEYRIRTVALVVEVDSDESNQILVRCSDDRSWLLAAFLNEALETVDETRRALTEDDE